MPEPAFLVRGARVLGAQAPGAELAWHEALLIRSGRVAAIGSDAAVSAEAGPGARVIEADGAVALPAFVDAHAHLTETGRAAASLDLSGVASAAQLLDAVRQAAARVPAGARILGHGWDESRWRDPGLPTAAQLEAAGGGAEVFLSRVDVHAGLASAGLLTRAGFDPWAGWESLDERAHARVREFATRTSLPQAEAYQRAALAALAAQGHVAVAEMAAPHVSGADDLRVLLALTGGPEAAALPRVDAYWARLVESPEEASEHVRAWGGRLAGLGGDLSVDGSLGARTAALREPYADAPGHRGELLLTAGVISAHVMACTLAGTQAAFHAIGDAAVDEIARGFSDAAAQLGVQALARAAHRVEHLEGIDAAATTLLSQLGVRASVQPRFDEYWGGAGALYSQRLGPERAVALNPLASMAAGGLTLALGSDTPVTGPDPWAAVRAAAHHHQPRERLNWTQALVAHTRGGHLAARSNAGHEGLLVPGAPGHVSLWRAPGVGHSSTDRTTDALVEQLATSSQRECVLTLRDGISLHTT